MLVEVDEFEVDVILEALNQLLLDFPEAEDAVVLYDRFSYIRDKM